MSKEKLLAGNDGSGIMLKIRTLAGIADKLGTNLNRVLAVANAIEQEKAIDGLLDEVRQAIINVEGQIMYAEPLREKLFGLDEYYLSPVLHQMHQELLIGFQSGKDLNAWPYKGLLLSGPAGTGKTEYARFLGHQLSGKADVYSANLSALRNSMMSGQALLSMYRELEQQARENGRYIILLFDEFEALIRAFSNEETFTSISDDSYGESGVRSRHENRRKINIDQKGEELIAVLKSILSGTGGIERVFTLCTSNQDEFNPALVRSGRLKQVDVPGFDILERSERGGAWNYLSLGALMQNVLSIWQAVHFRLEGAPNPAIEKTKSELAPIVQRANEFFDTATKDFQPLDFFQTEKIRPVKGKILNIYLAFWGQQYESRRVGNFAFDAFHGGDWRTLLRDAPELRTHFPADLAKKYKTDQSHFASEESVKKSLGELVFPQLAKGVTQPLVTDELPVTVKAGNTRKIRR